MTTEFLTRLVINVPGISRESEACPWFLRVSEDPLVRPARSAVLLASAYIVFGAAYILVSGKIAYSLASDVMALETFETIKGLGFILVTGFGLLGLTYFLLRRVALAEIRIARQHAELMRFERQVTAGTFASVLAHDVNNVLGVVAYSVDELRQYQNGHALDKKLLDSLSRSVEDLQALSRRLATAGREGPLGDFVSRNLAEALDETIDFAATHPRLRGCAVQREIDALGEFRFSPPVVHQGVVNLLLNAAEATNSEGSVLVRAERTVEGVRIEVHDNGPGVDPLHYKKVFDPFYTSKEYGTGLGLLSVHACARVHHGDIEVARSARLGGALFALTLRTPGVPEESTASGSDVN